MNVEDRMRSKGERSHQWFECRAVFVRLHASVVPIIKRENAQIYLAQLGIRSLGPG